MNIVLIFVVLLMNNYVLANKCRFKDDQVNKYVVCEPGYHYTYIDIEELYEKFPDLTRLKIDSVSVNEIPLGLTKFKNLKYLEIINIWKVKLPKDLVDLKELRILKLINIQLKELPENFEKLINLVNISLDYNSITVLPVNFGALSELRNLSISDNLLSQLPESFQNLKHLTYVNLNNNQFDVFPESFDHSSSIHTIRMDYNYIIRCPYNIFLNPSLLSISLEFNFIKTLPIFLTFTDNLKEFNLRGNPFKQSVDKIVHVCKIINMYQTIKAYQNNLPSNFRCFSDGSVIHSVENPPLYLPKRIIDLYDSRQSSNRDLNAFFPGEDNNKSRHQILTNVTMSSIYGDRKDDSLLLLSVNGIYNKISRDKIHWNIKKLRLLRKQRCTYNDTFSNKQILYVWDKMNKNRSLSSENNMVFREFLFKITSVSSENFIYIETAKKYLFNIVKALMLPQNRSKVDSCIDIIGPFLTSFDDSLVQALDFCLYIYLGGSCDPDIKIKDYVDHFIATQKDIVFEGIVIPKTQLERPYNYYVWKNKIGKELGYDTLEDDWHNEKTRTPLLTVLDKFYTMFTPESIINKLTISINKIPEKVFEILEYNARFANDNEMKQFVAEKEVEEHGCSLTDAAIEFYLLKNSYLENYDPYLC